MFSLRLSIGSDLLFIRCWNHEPGVDFIHQGYEVKEIVGSPASQGFDRYSLGHALEPFFDALNRACDVRTRNADSDESQNENQPNVEMRRKKNVLNPTQG